MTNKYQVGEIITFQAAIMMPDGGFWQAAYSRNFKVSIDRMSKEVSVSMTVDNIDIGYIRPDNIIGTIKSKECPANVFNFDKYYQEQGEQFKNDCLIDKKTSEQEDENI